MCCLMQSSVNCIYPERLMLVLLLHHVNSSMHVQIGSRFTGGVGYGLKVEYMSGIPLVTVGVGWVRAGLMLHYSIIMTVTVS